MSGGYGYGEPEPTEKCPYCGRVCSADFVDVGVGMTQCGPYHCNQCGASEIGPYDEPRKLGAEEMATGWYAPGQMPGSSANVIAGKVVSHNVMAAEYRAEFKGNPLWRDKKYVEDWFADMREQKP